MMKYGYGAGSGDWLGFITWLVIVIDLILLGVWLWQKVSKK